MNDVLLHCNNLQKTFAHPAGDVHVLKGINFSLRKSEMVAILGRSGTGKSTFLQVLGTLDTPTEGHLFFQDTNLRELADADLSHFRNRNMGFVFQFHYLLPEFTAVENVMMPAWIAGQMDAVDARARELLEILQLGHRLHHRPMELSGGEQQRVSLARALMMKPEVIFTDEVTGNLDSKTGDEVLNYLKQINTTFGVSILSVTHQSRLAQKYYGTLYTMDDGQLVPGLSEGLSV